jgi:hypothetical protein
MTFHSIRLLLAAVFVSVFLGGCLGGGNTAPPPSSITVVPGDGQVTVSFVGDTNVQYWIIYAPAASISTEGSSYPAGYNWKLNVTSPYVITGLSNGTTYAFAMNGRTDNGPGGSSSASITAVPRPAGGYWTAGTALGGGANDLKGLTYGTASDASVNYLAVGAGSSMFKSLDGTTWTAITTGPTASFNAAQNGLGYFLASDTTGNIYRSSDLATWTASTTGGTSINALAASNGLAIAVGDSGKIFKSTDAITWTAATSSGVTTAQHLYGVSYTPTGLWIAVGAAGTILTSPDGDVWTSRNAAGNDLRAVAAQQNGTTFSYVAVGLGNAAWQSADGVTWTPVTGLVGDFYAITASSVQFLAVGSGGAAFSSTTGLTSTWAQTTTTGGGNGSVSTAASVGQTLFSVVNPTFKYVAVGAVGTNITSQ